LTALNAWSRKLPELDAKSLKACDDASKVREGFSAAFKTSSKPVGAISQHKSPKGSFKRIDLPECLESSPIAQGSVVRTWLIARHMAPAAIVWVEEKDVLMSVKNPH
jgi:hypothetical protein